MENNIDGNTSVGEPNEKTNKPVGGPEGEIKTKSDEIDPDTPISYGAYQKLLKEKRDLKLKHDANVSRLAEIDAKAKSEREAQLIADKEFEKVLAEKNQAIEKLTGDLTVAETNGLDYRKMHSFIAQLGSAKLDPKYFGLVPLESIHLDDSGDINQDSLVKAVADFKAEHPRLLITQKSDLPNKKVGDRKTGGLTRAEWKSLKSSKEQRERYKDIVD